MTQRKPPGLSFAGWVEQQIRAAERSGSFDNLPGTGQPIAGLNEPHDELSWVADKLRRENLSVGAVLPPALALAKEVEDLPERLSRLKSETAVRTAVEELNDRIRLALRFAQDGPSVRVMPRDVDHLVEGWHEQRRVAARARLDEQAAAGRAADETVDEFADDVAGRARSRRWRLTRWRA